MLNDNAKAWLAALRSGKYKQGKNWLHRDGKYCCLGVACDLYQRTEGTLDIGMGPSGCRTFNGAEVMLPEEVREWLGLAHLSGANDTGFTLWELNDIEKWTFEQIANFIESEPAGLFVEPEMASAA